MRNVLDWFAALGGDLRDYFTRLAFALINREVPCDDDYYCADDIAEELLVVVGSADRLYHEACNDVEALEEELAEARSEANRLGRLVEMGDLVINTDAEVTAELEADEDEFYSTATEDFVEADEDEPIDPDDVEQMLRDLEGHLAEEGDLIMTDKGVIPVQVQAKYDPETGEWR